MLELSYQLVVILQQMLLRLLGRDKASNAPLRAASLMVLLQRKLPLALLHLQRRASTFLRALLIGCLDTADKALGQAHGHRLVVLEVMTVAASGFSGLWMVLVLLN